MPVPLLGAFMGMLPELEAEMQLAAIEAAAFPHMEQNDRESVRRHYQRAVGGVTVIKPESLDEYAALGIKVVMGDE